MNKEYNVNEITNIISQISKFNIPLHEEETLSIQRRNLLIYISENRNNEILSDEEFKDILMLISLIDMNRIHIEKYNLYLNKTQISKFYKKLTSEKNVLRFFLILDYLKKYDKSNSFVFNFISLYIDDIIDILEIEIPPNEEINYFYFKYNSNIYLRIKEVDENSI